MMDSVFDNKHFDPESVIETLVKKPEDQSVKARVITSVTTAAKLALEAELDNDGIKREYGALILYVINRMGLLDDDMVKTLTHAAVAFTQMEHVDMKIGGNAMEHLQNKLNEMTEYLFPIAKEYRDLLSRLNQEEVNDWYDKTTGA